MAQEEGEEEDWMRGLACQDRSGDGMEYQADTKESSFGFEVPRD